jgi:hypothetical protein
LVLIILFLIAGKRSGDRKDFAPTLLEGLGISREAIGAAPAVEGYSLYSPFPFSCVSEGNAFIDYPGAPACCTGLDLISFEAMKNGKCIEPSGATGNLSGYCTLAEMASAVPTKTSAIAGQIALFRRSTSPRSLIHYRSVDFRRIY